MEDAEMAELLLKLHEVLREAGLDALVEQEQATARVGQVQEFAADDRTHRGNEPAARKGEFRVQAIGMKQRWANVLDLIEAAVAGAHITEQAVLAAPRRLTNGGFHTDVTFADPSDDLGGYVQPDTIGDAAEGERSWTLGERHDDERSKAIREVVHAVQGLREHFGVVRGAWLRPVQEFDQVGLSWPA
ncbi:MAG: hypothetical protein LBC97_09735 [Bifidobacteriaceae bacterium]|nr:hypothetical protein [Bifidobacteriaceae bacterium]